MNDKRKLRFVPLEVPVNLLHPKKYECFRAFFGCHGVGKRPPKPHPTNTLPLSPREATGRDRLLHAGPCPSRTDNVHF
eukprot:7375863-Prymnesium_polylepis.1